MSVSPRKQPPPSPPLCCCAVVRHDERARERARDEGERATRMEGDAAASGNGPTVGVLCVV